jgi:hypothetical protein
VILPPSSRAMASRSPRYEGGVESPGQVGAGTDLASKCRASASQPHGFLGSTQGEETSAAPLGPFLPLDKPWIFSSLMSTCMIYVTSDRALE